jgi:hypothetical protein
MGLTLMARFFLGCHVTILLTIALVKLSARLEDAFKRRMSVAAAGESKAKSGLAATTTDTSRYRSATTMR